MLIMMLIDDDDDDGDDFDGGDDFFDDDGDKQGHVPDDLGYRYLVDALSEFLANKQ